MCRLHIYLLTVKTTIMTVINKQSIHTVQVFVFLTGGRSFSSGSWRHFLRSFCSAPIVSSFCDVSCNFSFPTFNIICATLTDCMFWSSTAAVIFLVASLISSFAVSCSHFCSHSALSSSASCSSSEAFCFCGCLLSSCCCSSSALLCSSVAFDVTVLDAHNTQCKPFLQL